VETGAPGALQANGFADIRQVIKEGKLLSYAREGNRSMIKEAAGVATVIKGFLLRMLGKGAAGKVAGRNTIGALLKWVIKTLIKAARTAGIVGTVGYIAGTTPGGTPPGGTPSGEASLPSIKPSPMEAGPNRVAMPQKRMDVINQHLTPTGAGLSYKINTGERFWIVPLLIAGSGSSKIAQTMFYWAASVYKEVRPEHRILVMTSSAFIQMAHVLSMNYTQQSRMESPNFLQMPQNQYLTAPVNSIKDVVDYFIWQTAPKIGSSNEK